MLIIAGPCAAESREQVLATAKELAAAGIRVFRAGVWKPRSMPGTFEGVGEEALSWLQEAGQTYGLEIATEVANAEQTGLALQYGVTWLWLGARTTTNPFLVQEIADALRKEVEKGRESRESKEGKEEFEKFESKEGEESKEEIKVLVKNPLSPDINLWEGAVRRIKDAIGEEHVLAVHRGFQTGQPTEYRNAACWSIAFELRRRMPEIPLLLDASHMAGKRSLIPALCQKGLDLGYDGLMLESHCAPETALSDAGQQLTPAELKNMLDGLRLREEPGSKTSPLTNRGENTPGDRELIELRNRIDETDDAIWALIAQRMEISQEIGDYKKAHGMSVLQSGRFASLLERRLDWARQHGLSEDIVRRIMDAIHEESCKRQL